MLGKRDYAPAVIVHRPDCPDLQGRTLPQLATAEIAGRFPNGRQHHCYHYRYNPVGLVEQVEYAPHPYEESSVTYEDATKPMCVVCGGTHGVLDALILPVAARVVTPPPRQE